MPRVRFARAIAVVLACLAAAVAPASAAAPFTPWCGGADEAAADRQPDAVSAFQVHVVYVVPSDGTSHFADRVSAIDTDMAAMDVWWRVQDPARTPRFDLASFPGCASTFGQLDVSSVRLAHDSTFYAPIETRYARIRADLDAAGFVDPDKKYLVYYDGPVLPGSSVCGQSDTGIVEGGPQAYSIVYLTGVCAGGLGAGGVATVIATHELIHGFNALAFPPPTPGPPHACPGDQGHPCDSPTDILSPSQSASATLDALVLDVGRDDYYGHSGSWWDVQDSPFLARLDSADKAPPSAPTGLTVTSRTDTVSLSWQPSTDDVGPIVYRVYRDGALIGKTSAPHFQDAGIAAGRTHLYEVRAADTVGFLSTSPRIRFTVGLGIVDEAGRLVRDTVPPPGLESIHARATRTSIVLSWRGVSDPGGLRGYRAERNGALYALVTRPTVSVPRSKAAGRWTVRAVDRAGNLGDPARIVVR